MGIAHIALKLRLGNKGCNRVDDYYIDRAASDEGIGNIECLFAVVGLGYEKGVEVNAELG